MISGIFSTSFKSGGGTDCGVAVFSGNTIHGGDASFYYRGKYTINDRNLISGTIEFIRYSHLQYSVVGPMDEFTLLLNGQVIVNDKEFSLSAPVEGHPELLITIALKKLDELIV